MKIKSFLAKPFANFIARQVKKDMDNALKDQQQILNQLIRSASQTEFGREHGFGEMQNHNDFKSRVRVRDYEAFIPYIDKIKQGRHNVLWKGQPAYFAKTSGTTSGVKYIPITKDSIPNHIHSARNALLHYMAETGNTAFADGKMIFLSGSPELERVGGIPTGRLSGIVNHHVPAYLRRNQLPSYETNCIEEWEHKLEQIVEETIAQPMTLISGIPPWMQMYFDKLQEKSGKNIGTLFPGFSVMVQGGVNFEPYRNRLAASIGRTVDCIELFPASEGFFAFQDSQKEKGLLLNTNSGIFYEFIPVADVFQENPRRLQLSEVTLGENYALVISSNAGLWAYSIGDTVRFVSLDPYRLIVSGRIKHFISAFGEHVIGEEVEAAMLSASAAHHCAVTEFTVAPLIAREQGKSFHEWFIEFETPPADLAAFAKALDDHLRAKNVYYDDLVGGNILQPLKVQTIKKNGFINFMKSVGKLGGQNKVPRLSNDRSIADVLQSWSSA